MAYLTFTGSEDKQINGYAFIGSEMKSPSVLIGNSESQPMSLLASNVGGGEDTCSFYNGPTDSVIFAFGESAETSGSIAYSNGSSETSGSIALSGGCESSGSVASSVTTGSSSSSSSFSCSC